MEASKIPWHNGQLTELDQIYLEKGFFPALKQGQAEWVPEVHSFEYNVGDVIQRLKWR